MATDYPYAVSITRLSKMLDKIAITGTPSKVDGKWLSQIGFGTDNDRRALGVLRQIGFIGSDGKPTEIWNAYRGANRRAVLGSAIKTAYPDLFHTYPQAQTLSDAELENFIRSNTPLGPRAVELASRTFKALGALADFDDDALQAAPVSDSDAPSEPARAASATPAERLRESQWTRSSGVVINVNLQLTLPETVDAAVYDALFAALNKHILSGRSADEQRG